ncbi:glycerophosphodiester phosphodiesterase family protein [Kosmotoga pacifica]|uniref:Glycerophosphodiester phosphodiesterase n=2 Tax=Kosmotoga pacifica TaxID=1330330 RepID=A0A0G2Z7E8_9BACT|nr:glycerophosphodiester phosphodiesterase family protein [Kosmotoga pacifica]AKI97467.1 glycerophosphodiester phosphodiesterase [Kosmotoga pacifica]
MVKVLGHRGMGKGEGENSLLSLIRATQFGADGVETDVWLTKDGSLILTHDEDLKRLFGIEIKIKEVSYKELKKAKLISDEKLTTLEKAYLELPNDAIINVEIKDPDAAKFVVPLVRSFNALDRTIFSSFIHECLLDVRKSDPKAKIGLLIGEEAEGKGLEYIEELIAHYNPYSMHLPVQIFENFSLEASMDLLKSLRERNIKVALWTLNDSELAMKVRTCCDYLITDNLMAILAVRGGR